VQISELAARSRLTIPTVKYYLRLGLLPAGEQTSATRATYAESHLRRLTLIRALAEVAGLSLDQIRSVLATVDDESASLHAALGSAHNLLSSAPAPDPAARDRVDALLRRWGWRVHPHSTSRDGLARGLGALDALEHPLADGLLDAYAGSMHAVAVADIDSLPAADREAAVERAVVGTLLLEPVLLALRRLAQEDVSQRRFGRDDHAPLEPDRDRRAAVRTGPSPPA
jgi:DNA-binding transcriptional MerR regulator